MSITTDKEVTTMKAANQDQKGESEDVVRLRESDVTRLQPGDEVFGLVGGKE
jgi:hypothetical protein